MRGFMVGLALFAAAPWPLTEARAQETANLSADLQSAVAQAELRGQELYRYDQAAWHATDALAAKVDLSSIENPRGYVVVPGETEGVLETIFVVERAGELREFAHFSVRQSEVVAGDLVEGELPALSPLAERMFKAREPALAAMVAEGYSLCSRSSPNTLTLPPDESGNVSFYLLTSTQDNGNYPIGGHYRVDIAPDASVAAKRRYMNTCFNLPTAPQIGPEGNEGHAGVSYLFGDAPSEIHVFASFQFQTGFMVNTESSRKLWLIKDGRITLVQEDFDPLREQ